MRIRLREGDVGTFLLVASNGQDSILVPERLGFSRPGLNLRMVPVSLRRDGRHDRLRAPTRSEMIAEA